MANPKGVKTSRPAAAPGLVRTSVLVPADVDKALRELADKGKRPLSWEIRQALEKHVREAA